MKKRSFLLSLAALVIVLLATLACNLQGAATPTPTIQFPVVTAPTQATATMTATDTPVPPTPPVTNLPAGIQLPDLFVSEFTIFPVTPIQGQPAHVRIGIYNQGNAPASQFTVTWYGLSTFTTPSCSWNIVDKINPNSGRILDCDFIFKNRYPINKTSLVIVDATNQVVESNEYNNQGVITPFGVNKP